MRTLNDFFLFGGAMSAIQTEDNASSIVVAPDDGYLKAVIINIHTVADADNTFDIMKNAVDTTVDVTLPDETVDETGFEMLVPTEVPVVKGDAIYIRSNGDQTAACLADVTFVFGR